MHKLNRPTDMDSGYIWKRKNEHRKTVQKEKFDLNMKNKEK